MIYMEKYLLRLLTLVTLFTSFGLAKGNEPTSESLKNPSYTYADSYGFSYEEATSTISGSKQALFYGEYKASGESRYEWVIHSIRSGSTTTRTNVLNIAKDYEKTTGRKVIFATNGDYFDLNSGSNMESYVNNGIVISKGSFATKHCIGFDNNGKVVIGRMEVVEKRLMLVIDGETKLYKIDKFNEQPLDNEIAIYNAAGTYSLSNCGRYIIQSTSSNLSQCPVWGESKRMSKGDKISSSSLTLKSGQYAIVLKDGELNDYLYDKLIYGVEANVVEIPSGKYEGCTWVLGGYDILVDEYVTNTKCHTDNSGNVAAPRTFIGFKEDGTCFLCVVDGRQSSYSVGLTVNEEAKLAHDLNAKYALELDGGGSSTVILRLNDELVLRNKPSDGSMRGVSNAIMLVEKEAPKEDNGGNNDNTTTTTTTNTTTTQTPTTEITTTTVTTSSIETSTTPTTTTEENGEEIAIFGCKSGLSNNRVILLILVLLSIIPSIYYLRFDEIKEIK